MCGFKLIGALLLSAVAHAQTVQPYSFRDNSFHYKVNIGNGSSVATHASAVLELKGNYGFLPNRLSTVQRDVISSPANSLLIFNTDLGRYQYYLNGSWVDFAPLATGTTPVTSVFGRTGVVTAQAGDYTLHQVMTGGNTTRTPLLLKSSNTSNAGTLVSIGEASPTQGEIKILNTATPSRFTSLQAGNIQSNDFQYNSAAGAVTVSYSGTGYFTQEFQAKNGLVATVGDIPTDNAGLTNGAGYITASALTPFLTILSAASTYEPLLGYTAENSANKATGFGTLNNTLYPTTQAVATYVTGQGYITSSALAPYATTSSVAAGYFPLAGGAITGSAGAGFIGLPTQSAAPTGVSGQVRVYADASGRFSWTTGLGFSRTFASNSLTANRVYTLKDADGTLAFINDIPTNNSSLTNGAGYITASAVSIPSDRIAYGNASGNGLTSSSSLTFSNNNLWLFGSYNQSGTVTANGGIARAFQFQTAMAAAANNDVLTGLYVAPTFSVGSYTGVSQYTSRFINASGSTFRVESPSGATANIAEFQVGSTAALQINSTGELLLNSSTDQGNYRLQVAGNAYVSNLLQVASLAGAGVGFVTVDGAGAMGVTRSFSASTSSGLMLWWDATGSVVTSGTYRISAGWGSQKGGSYTALQGRGGLYTGDQSGYGIFSESGVARAWWMNNNLILSANGDLIGVDLDASFSLNGYSGDRIGLRVKSGLFQTNGGRRNQRGTLTAAATLSTFSDHFVTCNTSASGFTVTLPAGTNGDEFWIRHSSGSSNTLTIATTGGATVAGNTSGWTGLASGSAIHLIYNSTTTNWEQY